MTSASAELVAGIIGALGHNDEQAALSLLLKAPAHEMTFAAMMRTAIFHVSRSPFFYRKLLNVWSARTRPALKPSSRAINIELLSDCTVDGIVPYLELFCAAYGIEAHISIAPYDSVEQTALVTSKNVSSDVSIVLLSDYWVRKHIGVALVSEAQVAEAVESLGRIVDGLYRNRAGHVIVGNFSPSSWPLPGACVFADERMGQSAAVAKINTFLQAKCNARVHILDTALAIHMAGGGTVAPRLAYLRAHAFLEERGLVQVARETASGIAQLFGRSHRALLTDWDNTLWGGEVGELGFHQVMCGQDSPDALGYYFLQTYLVGLTRLGVLLAAVSRNDPAMASILDENTDLAIRRSHFSSLALSWGNKSESVGLIERELNFGTDLMVYVDDNPVDLAQVILRYPYIDIVLAGPTADYTLARLSSARYFNALRITEEDSNRAEMTNVLAEQNRQIQSSPNPADFLRSLQIKLTVSPINDANLSRVLALLQKTNQFNVTTKRYTEQDLRVLENGGANIGVFSYSDRFGPQGIIGLAILVATADESEVDTWLMSCRVLNRNVEKAMFSWIREKAAGKAIKGTYIPTPKNGLVRDLYDKLGFQLLSEDGGTRFYKFKMSDTHVGVGDLELIYE